MRGREKFRKKNDAARQWERSRGIMICRGKGGKEVEKKGEG
jgi:hypothetical protein